MAATGQEERLEERLVEVLCHQVNEDLLYLYFENANRSGGGTLTSVTCKGNSTLLEFADAEAAARVLSRRCHSLQDIEFIVRKPASKDKYKLLLRGVTVTCPLWTVELYLENMMGMSAFTLCLLSTSDLIIVHFHQPFTEDLPKLNEKMSKRSLQGANLTLEEIEQTDSILVEKLHPGTTSQQLLNYFKTHLNDGHSIVQVSLLSEDSATVSFVNFESVDAALNIPHQSGDMDVSIKPFYSFLQPTKDKTSQDIPMDRGSNDSIEDSNETLSSCVARSADVTVSHTVTEAASESAELAEDEVLMHQTADTCLFSSRISVTDSVKLSLLQTSGLLPEIEKANADCAVQIKDDGVHITGPAEQPVRQMKVSIVELVEKMAVVNFVLEKDMADFLTLENVEERLRGIQLQNGCPMIYTVSTNNVALTSLSQDMADLAAGFVKAQLFKLSIPVSETLQYMFSLREWPEFLQTLDLSLVKVSEMGDAIHVVTLKDLSDDIHGLIQKFLATPVQREAHISMDPYVLMFVQNHYHQLLADMGEVSIIPIEDKDMCGLKIYGPVLACQMAEEVLQGVVSSVLTKKLKMHAPGIVRFFYDTECSKLVEQMQQKFRVLIRSKQQPWTPPPDQDLFKVAWTKMPPKNFQRHCSRDTTPSDFCVLDYPMLDLEGEAVSQERVDEGNLEEEAQLSLAIQYSLESVTSPSDEEEQLKQALEMSRQMIQQEVVVVAAAEASADTIEIDVFADYRMDLIRVDVALDKRLGQRKVKETLERKSRQKLSDYQQQCLDLIMRKHAVDIETEGNMFIISGFVDYVNEAVSDVRLLIQKESSHASDQTTLDSVEWVWHDPITLKQNPYSCDAALLIEKYYQMKLEKLDIMFNHQPYVLHFDTMEEYNVTTGKSVKISRRQDYVGKVTEEEQDQMLGPPKLVRLPCDSEEYKSVVERFLQTSSREIHVVQVAKFQNNLLHCQYKLKKASVLLQAGQDKVERTLYHGTSESAVNEILFHGFNRSYSGKNGAAYGNGVYFAVNSSLSLKNTYSSPNLRGHKFIIVAKVLTGAFTLGALDMRTAPLKKTSGASDTPIRYDSVTDNLLTPTLFVIFNDTQAYPEYLITCEEISS
ncbi:protein mono-ADP-ribosyltransferase PARP10 isoform X1 [Synchiropus splendidus]|uniref:protein mono-ADP-ribosyltransferase PARP10 isoform X1 n=1 Tax=Synchiropus splendidus TaxID=270530 RepID=UPI00237E0300|nr:protein mono-ADP-ribosyltransferase PARP10 isoform X1 [Synchiropus splendidus]